MPTLTIDGRRITVPDGTTVLQAAERLGIFIPHYCYHPALSVAGSCRLCFVHVEKIPKLLTSCSTLATEGMVVRTDTPDVVKGRQGVLEFLLINHPLDCPVCDQAGECYLQDYSFKYGTGHSRFREVKRTIPKKDLGPSVVLYTNRCILCSRCIRFCREIAGAPELDVFERGGKSQIDIYPGRPLTNKLAGNVVDICPVGALLDKDYLHKSRVWNLASESSVCTVCSTGCNIRIDRLGNAIHRVKPRYNRDVNEWWMCDDGRYAYHAWERLPRLETPLLRRGDALTPVSWGEALKTVRTRVEEARRVHGPEAIAGIGSATATNEENALLQYWMHVGIQTPHLGLYHAFRDGERQTYPKGFVIEGDKNPNAAGAQAMLEAAADSLDQVLDALTGGRVQFLYVLKNDPRDGFGPDQIATLRKAACLVVQDVVASPLTEAADVVLPSASPYETTGTVTNARQRVQRLGRALEPPGEAREGWRILGALVTAVTGLGPFDDAAAVFNTLIRKRAGYEGMTFYKLGALGQRVGEPEAVEA